MRRVRFRQLNVIAIRFYVLNTLFVIDVASGRDMVVRIAVLAVIELLPHHVVQPTTPEVEYLLEGLPEVPVECRVDDRVEQTICVAQPQEQTRECGQSAGSLVQERPDEGQHEEWQPAYRERAHDDAQGRARLSLFGQLETQLLLICVNTGGCFGRSQQGCLRLLPRGARHFQGVLSTQHRALGLVALPRAETPAQARFVQTTL